MWNKNLWHDLDPTLCLRLVHIERSKEMKMSASSWYLFLCSLKFWWNNFKIVTPIKLVFKRSLAC